MYADNFYIALYDEDRQLINFPFYRDEVDPEIPDPNAWEPFGVGNARGSTAYMLRHGKPKLLAVADYEALVKKGELEIIGIMAIEWMGAPLKADGRTVGVIAVQTYREDRRYAARGPGPARLRGAARRVRAGPRPCHRGDAAAQRGAGIVNEIGAALAEAARLPGDHRARRRARRQHLRRSIAVHRPVRRRRPSMITLPVRDRRRRARSTPSRSSSARARRRASSRRGTSAAHRLDRRTCWRPAPSRSEAPTPNPGSGVPIIAGDRVIGVIALESVEAERLHARPTSGCSRPLASSMGVALENARLFDETKRLLAETDERAAELAIINSVQAGPRRAARHAGDVRPRRRRDPGDLRRPGRRHRAGRPATGHDPLPVHDRARRALHDEPIALVGLRQHVVETGASRSSSIATCETQPRGRPAGASSRRDLPKSWLGRADHRRRRGHRRDLRSRTSTARTPSRGRRPAPHDARLEPERRARERAPVRRDEAPPRRDR